MKPLQDDFLTLLLSPGPDAKGGGGGGTFTAPGGTIYTTRRFQRTNAEPPHYYRCNDCLSTFTTETKLAMSAQFHRCAAVLCACGCDRVEYLGKSTVDRRLQETRQLAACDARCTEATGPNCTCQCGGVNHGTGKLVTVIVDKGPIPRVNMPHPEKAKADGDAFRAADKAALARIEERLKEPLAKQRAGAWVETGFFWQIKDAFATWRHARSLKTLKGRLKALEEVK